MQELFAGCSIKKPTIMKLENKIFRLEFLRLTVLAMWVEEVSETISWTASRSFSRWRLLVIPNSCSNSASVRLCI